MTEIAAPGRTRDDALMSALESRSEIGIAIGILMTRSGLGRDDAFDLLVRASQRENRKLRDIAAQIVARHDTPPRRWLMGDGTDDDGSPGNSHGGPPD